MNEERSARQRQDDGAAPPAAKKPRGDDRGWLGFCVLCDQAKPLADFSKNQRINAKKGNSPKCLQCCIAANKKPTHLFCSVCKSEKSLDLFSKKERKKGDKARCHECDKKERAELERQKQERRRADRAELERQQEECRQKAYIREQKKLEANGPQLPMATFEAPGFPACWDRDEEAGWDRDEATNKMIFKEKMSALDKLVGTYDLIFYYTEGAEADCYQNRTTRGTLEFTMNGDLLVGTISIHKSVKNDIDIVLRDDVKIRCKPFGKLEVTNIDELEGYCGDADVQGTIQSVAERRAVRYMPESDGHFEAHQQDYARSIQFENAKEAQAILDKYRYPCGAEPLMWVSNHLNLPTTVSSLIGGFATCKPQPVFIFEEDDLFLTIDWSTDFHHGYATVLVARRI